MLALFSFTAFFAGCSNDPAAVDSPVQNVSVEVDITAKPADRITRATDETQIKDLNVYLFGKTNTFKLHIYTQSPLLLFECPVGEYDIYIAANLHADMGDLSPAELAAASVDARIAYDDLPMSVKTAVTISVPEQGNKLTLPAIEVRRIVAKIAYNIRVDSSVSDIELKSVKLMNIPRHSSLFTPARPSASGADYTDGFYSEIPTANAASFSDVCYIFENMQGSVPSITSQSGKSSQNAPKYASYLLVRAIRGAKVLSYSIFLGKNNTDNFDVSRNTHQTFNITIRGDNEVDTRISSYTLRVWDDFDDYNFGGYCLLDGTRYLHVEVECNNGKAPTCGRLELLSGDLSGFTFDYGNTGAVHDFDLYDMMGDNTYEMEYYVPGYTEKSSLLAYRITLTDTYGFSQTFDFEHRMANAIRTHIVGSGTISVEGALHSETQDDLVTTLCMTGCTLTASPASGYMFDGWYYDNIFSNKVSSQTRYTFKPTAPLRHVYTRFRAETIPLDDKGTANCYIAPKLNTSYSFDATVQGNGQTTMNVWPQQLHGVSARTLWETGTLSKTVIKDVAYADGRISFTTGSERGNALIGLFDSREECIWSWHVWSVDYTPVSQTYVSGAVFMDRNLGALTSDCTQPASRGLYYQWGRKDPFPYPATCQDIVKRADAVYAEGFEYAVSEPRNAAAESPYDVMTVEWAIAHPTTFMNDAMYEDWEEWASRADWHYPNHPNLWGNVTTNKNNISRVSQKSIYDPCPPGWKVPSPEDFQGITGVSQSMPYYVTIHYNGNRTTNIPLGGTFSENRYMGNGQSGCLYTNAPYQMRWGSPYTCLFYDIACTIISFSTSSYSSMIGTMDYYRYSANPIRCIRE